MGSLGGPFVVAVLLLGLGGALEVRRPAATVGAMRAMRLPTSGLAVRFGGATATTISVVAVVWPTRIVALAVAAVYLMLSGFVAAALLRDVPLGSCGCFGRSDTPATAGHLVIDLAAAAVAGAVALGPGSRGWESVHLDGRPLVVVLFVVLIASAVSFAYIGLTVLPGLVPRGDGEVSGRT